MTLPGKRDSVVVTGASSGIGLATVTALAKLGYDVFAGVRTAADARALNQIANVEALQLDVTDPLAIAGAVEAVRASNTSVCGLVNNAGIAVSGPLEAVTVADLRQQFEINVIGAVAVSQAFLPLIRASRGRLVFVGSISGHVAFPFIAPYSASKFALRAIADAWRVELEPNGVRVVLVEPGSVNTPIWGKGRERATVLLGRLDASSPPHYRREYEMIIAHTASEERTGIPPERVANAIVSALRAERPRLHDAVGGPSRLGRLLGLLPLSLQDRLVAAPLKRR